MPRTRRLHLPGGLYHVTQRGNAGQDIFHTEPDRAYFSDLVEQGVSRFGHRIHAFCWMSNHFHLAIQVRVEPLPVIMHSLTMRYARWLNRRRNTHGHVFERRYGAILVDTDEYLLELVRYIHLNPVRAGLAREPAQFPWTSHRTYLGQAKLAWVTTDWLLAQFARDRRTAVRLFIRFIAAGCPENMCAWFERGSAEDHRLLGGDRFMEEVRAADTLPPPAPRLDELEREVCRRLGVTKSELLYPTRRRRPSRARAVIAWAATESGCATLAEVARRYRRSPSTLRKSIDYYRAAEPELFANLLP